ncbi:hypothetical protein quinque_008750 [Culex quinquefasciatus]
MCCLIVAPCPIIRPIKKFMNKRNAVTFRLFNRIQQDSLFIDETAPQLVIVPVSASGGSGDDDPCAPSRAYTSADMIEQEKDKQENEVYRKPVQPSSVFASEVEGLKKTQMEPELRPDWDPVVVAALNEDFHHENPDNALDDNFMELEVDSNEAEMSDEEEERDGLTPLAFDQVTLHGIPR